jgi:predicted small metal-binding protein
MPKNVNCAEMGYDCAFSVSAEDDKQEYILETIQKHATKNHLDLIGEDSELKPEVKAKLLNLLNQSQYHKQGPN